MDTFSDLVEVLSDQKVRAYFLGILESNLPSAEKYQRFIDFFARECQIRSLLLSRASQMLVDEQDDVDKILSQVGHELGIWNPQKILAQTEDSIRRAIHRLKKSRHPDGGWGPKPGKSDLWGTAYAVLCLNSARRLKDFVFDVDIDEMLKNGMDWVERNDALWSVKGMPPAGTVPVYHASVVIQCFYQTGRESFRAVGESVQELRSAQNADGGWDAHIWGDEERPRARVYSEVGATSFAVQALAGIGNLGYADAIARAIHWLVKSQNADGSWNNGSYHPGAEFLSGQPSIKTTGEALQGILAGRDCGIIVEQIQSSLVQAVGWLESSEKPIFDADRNITGWGWLDYDNTCLMLETLVRMPDTSLPLLSSNAHWLIGNQHKEPGSDEDGNWEMGHTARIALSLIEYYKIVKESSLFRV